MKWLLGLAAAGTIAYFVFRPAKKPSGAPNFTVIDSGELVGTAATLPEATAKAVAALRPGHDIIVYDRAGARVGHVNANGWSAG